MHLRRAAVFLSLAALVPAAARADESLGTMTVSANRTETAVAASGSSVTVITAEEIEKKQAVTALDVIQDVPGVTLYRRGGVGKSSSISIRGIPSKGVLVLVDGMNVADPSASPTVYDLTNLMANDIERVEVLRGNQSTLYGSSAIGGVISITTKSGKGSGKVLTGEAGAEWGSFATAKSFVNARGESGNVYYSGAVSGFTSQGTDIAREGPDEADGYKNGSVNLRVGSDLLTDVGIVDRLNVETNLRYLKAHSEYDDWGGSSTTDADLKTRNIEQGGQVKVNLDLWDGLLANSFTVSQARTRRDEYRDDARDAFYDGEITRYEYQGTLKPVEHHTFVFGADHQREHADFSTSWGSSLTDSVGNDGTFFNYIVEPVDNLTLTAGVRVDDNDTFGDHTTWRTTASYRIPATGTRFHAGYGTGFRAPNLSELYTPTYGNPDLKPEKSRGYDVGFEQSLFDDRLTFGSTFFNTRLNDAISSDPATWQNVNIASARSFGFENSVSAEITDEISLTINHTYLQARDNATGEVLNTQPHHSANLRATYAPEAVPGLSTWTAVRSASWSYDAYAAKPYLGGYAVWDLGASYPITEWATVYGRLENLADKQYDTKGGYAEPGRAGYVGLRAKF